MSASINGTTGVTFPDSTTQATAASGFGFKNRIINGAMMIDQRNAGASVTLSGSSQYPTDRFSASKDTAGATCTAQQSSTAPSNFIKSLLWTTSTGATAGAGDDCVIRQIIEGNNFADFGFGTATAQSLTLSFWVRSSVTGTYGLQFSNSAANRCYMATYTVNVANTWEQKTVTIAGDTTGTWVTDTGIGLRIYWDMGSGTSRSIAASSAWGSSYGTGLTGGVKIAANTGATFYITGVQLEKGSTATSFDYRPYGTELALCQRYFQVFKGGSGGASGTTGWESYFQFPTPMRAAPSAALTAAAKIEDHAVTVYTQSSASVTLQNTAAEATKVVLANFTGLTASRYYSFAGSYSGAGALQFSAEL